MKPDYTTIGQKFDDALDANSGDTPKADTGRKQSAEYTPTYITPKTAARTKETDI